MQKHQKPNGQPETSKSRPWRASLSTFDAAQPAMHAVQPATVKGLGACSLGGTKLHV